MTLTLEMESEVYSALRITGTTLTETQAAI